MAQKRQPNSVPFPAPKLRKSPKWLTSHFKSNSCCLLFLQKIGPTLPPPRQHGFYALGFRGAKCTAAGWRKNSSSLEKKPSCVRNFLKRCNFSPKRGTGPNSAECFGFVPSHNRPLFSHFCKHYCRFFLGISKFAQSTFSVPPLYGIDSAKS